MPKMVSQKEWDEWQSEAKLWKTERRELGKREDAGDFDGDAWQASDDHAVDLVNWLVQDDDAAFLR